MAYHADHSIPATIEEWLDEFEMFSIYEVLPEILELWGMNLQTEIESKKKLHRSSRGNDHTVVFSLRCIEIGISIRDLDLLTIGMVMDIWTEKANDDVKYQQIATQEDFDKF